MDARVVARFYRVSPKPANSEDFHQILLDQMSLQGAERERILSDDFILRIERCASNGVFVEGEFCRIQKANLPPSATPSGLIPIVLEDGHGIGHMVAFRYHIPTRVILLQSNVLGATIGRIAEYLCALNAASIFLGQPVLSQDAWERFTQKPIRSMQISFASPENLGALDQEGIPAAAGARRLAEAYGGTSVEVIVGVGKKQNAFLNFEAVKKTIEAVVASVGSVTKARVKTVSASSKGGVSDPDEVRDINFLKEHMKSRKTLTLPEGDHDGNFAVRQAFLTGEMADRIEHLTRFYGPKPDGVFS